MESGGCIPHLHLKKLVEELKGRWDKLKNETSLFLWKHPESSFFYSSIPFLYQNCVKFLEEVGVDIR